MLKSHLSTIKGELLHYFLERYLDMSTDQLPDGTTKIDYTQFYEESQNCIDSIVKIKSVSDLDVFCVLWGLNDFDVDFKFSFYNLAKKYLELK